MFRNWELSSSPRRVWYCTRDLPHLVIPVSLNIKVVGVPVADKRPPSVDSFGTYCATTVGCWLAREMSQRRNASNPSKPAAVVVDEGAAVVKGPLALEMPATGSGATMEEKVPLSTQGSDLSTNNGEVSSPSLRVKKWKESPFAVGMTEPTWEAEMRSMKRRKDDDDDQRMITDDDYILKDTTGCLCCSAVICSFLGAGRVGNMVVLHSSTEWVEEVEVDEETNEEKVLRYTRPKLNWVMGPL